MELRKSRVHRVGDSLMITLPDSFVKEHGIKKGEVMVVVHNGFLQAIPVNAIHQQGERIIKDPGIRAKINPDPFVTAATELSQQIRKKYPDADWKELDYEVKGDEVVLKWVKLEPRNESK